jgi:hypothetical protein
MQKRVKFISHPDHPRDPMLQKGKFYTVTDLEVYVMNEDTPYITVTDGTHSITRPRHLFSNILTPHPQS